MHRHRYTFCHSYVPNVIALNLPHLRFRAAAQNLVHAHPYAYATPFTRPCSKMSRRLEYAVHMLVLQKGPAFPCIYSWAHKPSSPDTLPSACLFQHTYTILESWQQDIHLALHLAYTVHSTYNNPT